jgi:hypothetical protein
LPHSAAHELTRFLFNHFLKGNPMARYVLDESKPLARVLRDGLNSLRNGIYKLSWVLGALNQGSDQDNADALGLANTTLAANAKSELSSDVGKLQTDASQSNVKAALQQMLDQFA